MFNYFTDNLVLEKLKSLSPSKIDFEIRCLSPENGGSVHLMKAFLEAMTHAMKTKQNFEVLHAYLALFLMVMYCGFIMFLISY